MDYERKLVKKTLPPRLFFLQSLVDGAFGGVVGGSCCGFCLILHVESDGNR
jgi:hypothetical protein